uniref:junctional adhesion molecule A-like isoform X2 n=1 Tax=Semicossyphus pulcher TaxID=241346 RepID=UPI0037E71EB4
MVLKTLALFVALLCSTARTDNALYKAKGDEVVLMPTDKAPPFPNIEWKHGNDIAAELYDGKTECFRQFKGRCTLNDVTGELTITGLTVKDNGLYTLQIDNKYTNTKIQLNVMSPVSKPTISKSCNPEMTYCDLTCDGNTTDAEPITYIWVAGDSVGPLSRVFKITKDMKEDSFRCILVNPVSEAHSESITNPFKSSALNWLLISIVINAVLAAAVILLIGLFILKRRKGGLCCRSRRKNTVEEHGTPSEAVRMLEEANEEQPDCVTGQQRAPAVLQNGGGKCRILRMVVSETYDDDATTTMTTLPTSIELKTTYEIVFYFNEPARKLEEANEEQPDRVTVEEQGTPSEAVRMLEEANEEQPDRVTGKCRILRMKRAKVN